MIKAVLFDFDGTLANSLPYYVKAYDKALRKFGFKFTEKEIGQNCFNKTEETICKNLGIPEKTEEFRKAYFDAVKELSNEVKLFDDCIETLDFLIEKDIKIVIVTFAYRWYINKMIKQYQLDKYINLTISADDVERSKPYPDAVLKAISFLKINTNETIVVGDSINDILMGQAAGSKTVFFAPKEHEAFYDIEKIKSLKPTYVINKILEIRNLI